MAGNGWIPLSMGLGLVALLPMRGILASVISADGTIDMTPFGLAVIALRATAGLSAVLLLILRPGNAILKKLTVAAGSVLLCLLMAEVILRLVYSPPFMKSGWKSRASRFELNELGFRGHPIRYSADDFIVVLLGNSQVEANACAYGWMPERRLEYYLNDSYPSRRFRVFTVGAEGYGQDQQLLASDEYFGRYRADLVLLWQIPANDVWNNMFPTHWPANGAPKPTFRLEGGRLVGPNVPMGKPMTFRTGVRLVDLACNAVLAQDKLDERWEAYLPDPYSPIEDHDGPVNTSWQHRWDTNLGLMRQENLGTEKSHLSIFLTPRSERTQYGLDLTRALLSEIQNLVETHSGRFYIFETGSKRPDLGNDSMVYQLNGKHYRASIAQGHANQEYLNAGFRTFTIPVTVEDSRVGPADGHLNEHAVDQVMRDLATTLIADLPFLFSR
jgi:hypothetical protein